MSSRPVFRDAPCGRHQLVEGELDRLKDLECELHRRVVGQEEASSWWPTRVELVADTIRRARVGLAEEDRPLGSFLFLGPTGMGKTELVKALAESLFATEKALVRIDMSEYRQPHTPGPLDRLAARLRRVRRGVDAIAHAVDLALDQAADVVVVNHERAWLHERGSIAGLRKARHRQPAAGAITPSSHLAAVGLRRGRPARRREARARGRRGTRLFGARGTVVRGGSPTPLRRGKSCSFRVSPALSRPAPSRS